MFVLILLSFIALAVIYGFFFLLFKVIWILRKKDSNKGPFIWAGVSTVLFGLLTVALVGWWTYKFVSPIMPIIRSVQENPAPVYGERVYKDPIYRFDITVFDGMEFSNWVNFDDFSAKFGIDTNVFKTNNEGKPLKTATTALMVVRQTDIDEDEYPFEELRQSLLLSAQRRRAEIVEEKDISIDGRPALYVSGNAFANNGQTIPFLLTAVEGPYQDVYYMVAAVFGVDEKQIQTVLQNAQTTVHSFQLPTAAQPQR